MVGNQDRGAFVEAVAAAVVVGDVADAGDTVVAAVAAVAGGTAAFAVAAVAIGNRESGKYLFAQPFSSYRVGRGRTSCPS